MDLAYAAISLTTLTALNLWLATLKLTTTPTQGAALLLLLLFLLQGDHSENGSSDAEGLS